MPRTYVAALLGLVLAGFLAWYFCQEGHGGGAECDGHYTTWGLTPEHTITITNPADDSLRAVRGSAVADTVRAQSSMCLLVKVDTVRAQ